MPQRNFMELLKVRWDNSDFVCLGLDIDFDRLPAAAHRNGKDGKLSRSESMYEFGCRIVDATCDIVAAYKPNSAFFEAHGWRGMEVLERLVAYVNERDPQIPVILDAKRGDIGITSEAYAKAAFDVVGADAVTVSPYLGRDALQPFLDRKDKGVFVLCRTPNPDAGEFQDIRIGEDQLYLRVAQRVSTHWNGGRNCGLVMGATVPSELRYTRVVAPSIPILVDGVGARGGNLDTAVHGARDRKGRGFLVCSSREVLYASPHDDYAQVARDAVSRLRRNINQYRQY
jgi:orotidine-5'-phosphate decarboxylase